MFEEIEPRESRYRKSVDVAVLLSAARGGEVVSGEHDHKQNSGRDSNRRNEGRGLREQSKSELEMGYKETAKGEG
ncbi:hypothetical protein Hdeb2414_s0014g00422341 [Helianthus debilis subsp. tardiflorus]